MPSVVHIGMLVLALGAGACAKPRRPAPKRGTPAVVDAAAVKPQADSRDGLCGYVDRNGKPAIERRFHQAGELGEGLAPVTVHDKTGFVDSKGGYVIAPTFDAAKGFREGLAAACVNGQGWGFVDKQGRWAIPPGFAFADSFADGTAVVAVAAEPPLLCGGLRGKRVPLGSECEDADPGEDAPDGAYYLVDRAGTRLHGKGYQCITRMSDGLAAARRNGKWGFLDRAGNEAIPPRFPRVRPFGEGWAAFWEADAGETTGGPGRWGFLNKQGRVVVRAKYRATQIGVFAQGLIAMAGLPRKTMLESPVGRACVLGLSAQSAEPPADDAEAETNCAAYLDKRGTIQVAVPFCHFDDVGLGERSPREFQGEFVEVVTMEPMSVYPFRCAPALTRDVRMFFNRRGDLVSPVAALSSRTPEGLVPSCARRRTPSEVDRFTLE